MSMGKQRFVLGRVLFRHAWGRISSLLQPLPWDLPAGGFANILRLLIILQEQVRLLNWLRGQWLNRRGCINAEIVRLPILLIRHAKSGRDNITHLPCNRLAGTGSSAAAGATVGYQFRALLSLCQEQNVGRMRPAIFPYQLR